MPSITQTLALVAATLSLTQALTVTSPTKFQLWDSGKTNTISWSSVSTDPQNFDIYLAHMAAHPPLYSLLFSDVSASTGKVEVSGLQLPTGDTYQINLVAHDNSDQILAQSQQFNVTGEAVAATSTVEGYTGPTYTATSSGSSATVKSTTVSKSATTLTKTTTDASGSATTETTTSTATESESTGTSTGTSSVDSASQTVSAASGSASATASTTANAAVANVAASGSIAALFFGVAAFLV